MSTAEKPEEVEASIELNNEFFTMHASPEQAKAALLLYQADAISFETLYDLLQQYGLTREGIDASTEQKEIKTQKVARPAKEPGKNPNPNDPKPPGSVPIEPYAPEGDVVAVSNPYHVEKRGSKYAVVKSKTGEMAPGGMHGDKAGAMKHLGALEANVKDA